METIGHKETRPDTILRLEFPQLYIYNINCDSSSSQLGIWPDRSTRTTATAKKLHETKHLSETYNEGQAAFPLAVRRGSANWRAASVARLSTLLHRLAWDITHAVLVQFQIVTD